MNDTKPQRLLIRLGAELSIVVLGVLIALGANEWWADRADRLQEAEILSAILEDIVASQELLRSDLDEQAGVLSHLLTVSGGTKGAAAGLSASELDEAIYYALWETPTFRLQMSAYEEAKSSGRLGLLRSPEIRRALAEFEAEVVRLDESYDDEMQHQQTKLDPYAMQFLDMTQFSEHALREVEGADPVAASDEPVELRPLLDDHVFKNLVTTKYFLMRNGHKRGEEIHERLIALEGLLNDSVGSGK